MTEWNGDERRGLPLHIISYIDTRLSEHTDTFNGRLDALQQEIYHLTQSIESFLDKQCKSCETQHARIIERCEMLVDEAIPTHPDNPDASPTEKRKEHRKAHASWIKRVDEEMDEWRVIRKRVKEWAILGALGIAALAVWQFLLAGPKP